MLEVLFFDRRPGFRADLSEVSFESFEWRQKSVKLVLSAILMVGSGFSAVTADYKGGRYFFHRVKLMEAVYSPFNLLFDGAKW